MKFIKVLFLVLIALIAVLMLAYFFAGTIFKGSVTRVSPALLGVPVSLDSATLDPIRGKVQIRNLEIDNPASFTSDYAFRLGTFQVQFNPLSALGDSVHIHEIEITGASILSDGLRADNHRAILEHLRSRLPAQDSTRPAEEKAESGAGKKLIIDHFVFTDSELIVMLEGEVITRVDFPELTLQEIGSKGSAVTLTEALTQVYAAIASETTRVLTVNEEVIENIGRAKLKSLGIEDVEDLKNPEQLLKDPKKLGNLLEALTAPKSSSGGG